MLSHSGLNLLLPVTEKNEHLFTRELEVRGFSLVTCPVRAFSVFLFGCLYFSY